MKIAVACEGKTITEHFGHCEAFAIFEAQGTQIVNKQFCTQSRAQARILTRVSS